MKKQSTVCYVASASGGHIIPCLTLARRRLEAMPETAILFFSGSSALDRDIIKNTPFITTHVMLPTLKSPASLYSYVALALALCITLVKLIYYLIKHRPDTIVCSGGIIAVPAALCARILAIPVELYELNVQPGKAVRFLASHADSLHICFAQTQDYFPDIPCTKTAYPVRFSAQDQALSQVAALKMLHLTPERKTVTLLGGSQGSLELNRLLHTFLIENPQLHAHLQIIHQTGCNDTFNWQAFYAQNGIPAHVFSFCSDLAPHYAAADLVICRAGAGTLHEVLFFGKQCIAVPLITKTNDHQLHNARAMQAHHPALFTAYASPDAAQLACIVSKLFS